MKMFENPELEVMKLDVADVITTSGGQGGNGVVTPPDEF